MQICGQRLHLNKGPMGETLSSHTHQHATHNPTLSQALVNFLLLSSPSLSQMHFCQFPSPGNHGSRIPRNSSSHSHRQVRMLPKKQIVTPGLSLPSLYCSGITETNQGDQCPVGSIFTSSRDAVQLADLKDNLLIIQQQGIPQPVLMCTEVIHTSFLCSQVYCFFGCVWVPVNINLREFGLQSRSQSCFFNLYFSKRLETCMHIYVDRFHFHL